MNQKNVESLITFLLEQVVTLKQDVKKLKDIAGIKDEPVVSNSQEDRMKKLMEKSINDMEKNPDKHPLLWATYCNQINIMKMLLDDGYKVDERDEYGVTALYLAVHIKCREAAKLLIDNGADPHLEVPC